MSIRIEGHSGGQRFEALVSLDGKRQTIITASGNDLISDAHAGRLVTDGVEVYPARAPGFTYTNVED